MVEQSDQQSGQFVFGSQCSVVVLVCSLVLDVGLQYWLVNDVLQYSMVLVRDVRNVDLLTMWRTAGQRLPRNSHRQRLDLSANIIF